MASRKTSSVTSPDIEDLDDKNYETPKIATKRFTYHFDFPGLYDSGYVEHRPEKIILRFPDKGNASVEQQLQQQFNFDVNLFLNKTQVFSFQWLPIYTSDDFMKVQEIFYRCHVDFLERSKYPVEDDSCTHLKYFNETTTVFECSSFQLECFENSYQTSLCLELHGLGLRTLVLPVNVQIFIGNNLVLCLERDFKELPQKHVFFIINLLLSKLIRY